MERLPPPCHCYRVDLKSSRIWALLYPRSEAGGREQTGAEKHGLARQAGEQWLGGRLRKTWNLGKIISACSSGQQAKPAGDDTWACSPLGHLSSLQSKHHGQAILSAPSSCLNHVPVHPLSQCGRASGLSPKSRKTQLLALTPAPPSDTQPLRSPPFGSFLNLCPEE